MPSSTRDVYPVLGVVAVYTYVLLEYTSEGYDYRSSGSPAVFALRPHRMRVRGVRVRSVRLPHRGIR